MTKLYNKYLQNLFESDDVGEVNRVPQHGGKFYTGSDTVRPKGTYKDDVDTIKSLLTTYIDTIASEDEKYEKFKDKPTIHTIATMASKITQGVEFDKDNNSIAVDGPGFGVMSSKFDKFSVIYRAVYLLVFVLKNPNIVSNVDGLNINPYLPFDMINLLMRKGLDINAIYHLTNESEESKSLFNRYGTILNFSFSKILTYYRANSGDSTISGKDIKSSTFTTKFASLFEILQSIDRKYFNYALMKGNPGNNYGGVKDENDALELFLQNLITHQTKESATNTHIEDAKRKVFLNVDNSISEVIDSSPSYSKFSLEKIKPYVLEVLELIKDELNVEDIKTIVNKLYIKTSLSSKLSDIGVKIIMAVMSPITKALLTKSIDAIKTPIDEDVMLELIDDLIQYNGELVRGSTPLYNFVSTNYPENSKVFRKLNNYLRKHTTDMDKYDELSSTDDSDNYDNTDTDNPETGSGSKMKEYLARREERKNKMFQGESFYDKMLSYIFS